jgi:seryl-tRNA synthetase
MTDDTLLNGSQEGSEGLEDSSEGEAGQRTVPYDRFSTVVKERNDAKAALAKLQKDADAAKKKALEEQQEWQRLYQEAQPQLERLEKLEALVASTLETLMEEVPSDMRDLIPGGDDGDVLVKWDWLHKAKRKGLFKEPGDAGDSGSEGDGDKAPGIPPGAPKGRSSVTISKEQLADPKWVRENKALIQQAARDGKLPR